MSSKPRALKISTLRLHTSHKYFSMNGNTTTTVESRVILSDLKWSLNISPKTKHGSYAICWIHHSRMEFLHVLRGLGGLLLTNICFIDEQAIFFSCMKE